MLVSLREFSGTTAIMTYSSMIFAATSSTLNPNTNTIISGSVQILGAYVALIFVDRFGRKILMIISSGGMGLGMAILGVYGFFNEQGQIDLSPLNWLPLTIMMFIIFISNIGIMSITYLLIIETLPAKVSVEERCIKVLLLFLHNLFRFDQLEHLSA